MPEGSARQLPSPSNKSGLAEDFAARALCSPPDQRCLRRWSCPPSLGRRRAVGLGVVMAPAPSLHLAVRAHGWRRSVVVGEGCRSPSAAGSLPAGLFMVLGLHGRALGRRAGAHVPPRSIPGLLEMLSPGWCQRRSCKQLSSIPLGGWLDTRHRDMSKS